MAGSLPVIAQKLGRYQILEKVGSGGMGVVYRARDERLDRAIALKVLPAGTLADETARKRFRQEALTLSRLNHPNIATVFDFDTQGGVDFLAMEYVVGTTLAQKLSSGPLAEKEVASLGVQVADALEEAHEQGVVHRDLKPGNIMITAKGRVKVLDFGIAKLLRPESPLGPNLAAPTESFALTQAVVGTLPYAAPEQLRGEPVDARTDLYALGAVLYEMVTGKRPFREELAPRLIDAIFHQPPAPLRAEHPEISPTLEQVILKCLEKNPANRYSSARDLATELRGLVAPTTPSAITAPAPRKGLSRRILVAASLAAAVIVALVVAKIAPWRALRSAKNAAGRIESLAVLPLENLSKDPDQEFFAEGMTDELITQLAKVSALRVISRTSVMPYKATQKSLPEIARELHVDAVVEGSVLRSGNRVRITAQLIRAATDQHLWAESYERDLSDVLKLQSEVARTIASEIRVQLTPQEQAHFANARAVNPEAYELYLRGRTSFEKWSLDGSKVALDYFQRAIDKDPQYAAPYAGMAEAYVILSPVPQKEALPKATEAVAKALELDETSSEAHTSLAMMKFFAEWDWAGAEKEFKRAIELNPNQTEARHFYSHLLMAEGRQEESLAQADRYMAIDPRSPAANLHLGFAYLFSRQNDRAIEQLRKTLTLDPNYAEGRYQLGLAYELKKNYPEAIAEFRKAVALSGGKRYKESLAHALAVSGNTGEAKKLLNELKSASKPEDVPTYGIALVYAGLGDKERAIEWLEKACDQKDVEVAYSLKIEPAFDDLHQDPRFQNLLRRVGLPL